MRDARRRTIPLMKASEPMLSSGPGPCGEHPAGPMHHHSHQERRAAANDARSRLRCEPVLDRCGARCSREQYARRASSAKRDDGRDDHGVVTQHASPTRSRVASAG